MGGSSKAEPVIKEKEQRAVAVKIYSLSEYGEFLFNNMNKIMEETGLSSDQMYVLLDDYSLQLTSSMENGEDLPDPFEEYAKLIEDKSAGKDAEKLFRAEQKAFREAGKYYIAFRGLYNEGLIDTNIQLKPEAKEALEKVEELAKEAEKLK